MIEERLLDILGRLLVLLPEQYYKLRQTMVREVFRNFGLTVYEWDFVGIGEVEWRFRVRKSRVKQWFAILDDIAGCRYEVTRGDRTIVRRIKETK